VNILPFDFQAGGDKALFTLATKDGTRVERSITLKGETIRFETAMTAGEARPFDCQIHPEYDTATASDDPGVLAIYVKQPEWTQINRRWRNAVPTDEQLGAVRKATGGGAYAYFNHRAKFGVEQTFEPGDFSSLGLFWNPSRQQINLELFSKVMSLEPGQQARYAYEVRYLKQTP
jgi:hypothetical protein